MVLLPTLAITNRAEIDQVGPIRVHHAAGGEEGDAHKEPALQSREHLIIGTVAFWPPLSPLPPLSLVWPRALAHPCLPRMGQDGVDGVVVVYRELAQQALLPTLQRQPLVDRIHLLPWQPERKPKAWSRQPTVVVNEVYVERRGSNGWSMPQWCVRQVVAGWMEGTDNAQSRVWRRVRGRLGNTRVASWACAVCAIHALLTE